MEKSYKEYLKNITTFVFDVDGVFTDGKLLITTTGEMLRTMDVKDGYALKTALTKGYNVCIISGGTNEGVRERLKALGVADIYLGAHQKETPLKEYLSTNNIKPEQVLYMGDDLPDIPPMLLVGLATCPQDATQEVKGVSKYISHKSGGNGCVRDVIEQVLKVRGDWYGNFDAQNA
ncbi:KdsC family phosphatase [Cellulophaga tyrosinoxydans]|jgi:3-deoxy-D-manno-octulosonate 8-phosphate phosphatase (KDO 8-P phosphatase)|uniref:3-deoxy-D-manno-octulosonate 8-phosphate phosphatase (KDO 8-P phosphatase) n=1 Tax=Cellulophaga tyrosinoxydans TaxID=504486 RepID=A0A1W1ZY75_9FLAO|nr:HAD-IIIA family hydrolase [Cellulophaga tyrosinoxydans]SMC53367.1 3-deoxy-D-manno-octulosonate 8-phosphate phosphatase (KDO 8-P phosphatase) [Cellulophaga tyrosinoxydans]|tara:strand:+ start:410 stop:937 length:528 start_codon:yes stop_codon:yes gene_type:complete